MKRKRIEKYLIDALIIIGLLLFVIPFLKDTVLSLQLNHTKLKIEDHLPVTIPEEETIHTPNVGDVLAPWQSTITGYGIVSIDSLHFQQPLLVGVTNQHLLKGGVVMFPERSLRDNNFVILGHHLGRQSMLFGLLNEAKNGMEVTVRFLNETRYYTIIKKEIVDETNVSVLENNQTPKLTLITCPTPTRTEERLVLTAVPIEQVAPQTSKKTRKIDDTSHSAESIIEKQENIWKQQSKLNWFLLFALFIIISGSTLVVHKFL